MKKENNMKRIWLNVPFLFTVSRIILAFLIVYMLFSGYSRMAIGIVFAIAALTDLFDGMLARKLNQITEKGKILDLIADRILVLLVISAFVVYFIEYTNESLLLLFLIISREIVALPGFLIRLVKGKYFHDADLYGKAATFLQSFTLALIIFKISWFNLNWPLYFALITCVVGIFAGFSYLKDAVKLK